FGRRAPRHFPSVSPLQNQISALGHCALQAGGRRFDSGWLYSAVSAIRTSLAPARKASADGLVASDPGKHPCAFDTDRLERVRIEAEQTEDRRRYLRR